MADIAAEFGVTESRVSQLRAEALVLLRDGLNAHLDPDLVVAGAAGRLRRPPAGGVLRGDHRAGQPAQPPRLHRPERVPCPARHRAHVTDAPSRHAFAWAGGASAYGQRMRSATYRGSAENSRKIPAAIPQGRAVRPDVLVDRARTDRRQRPSQGRRKIMGLRINQNIAAQNAYRHLSVTDGRCRRRSRSCRRFPDQPGGRRRRRPRHSEGLRSQVGGLKVAVRNAQDGVSVAQTAEGALTEVHAILQRMNDLAVQYSRRALGRRREWTRSRRHVGGVHRADRRDHPDPAEHLLQRGPAVRRHQRPDLPGRVRHRRRDPDEGADALADFDAAAAVAAVDIDDSTTVQTTITEISTSVRRSVRFRTASSTRSTR